MTDSTRKFKAQCHCGNIQCELDWPADVPLRYRKCGCQFCTRHGAIYCADPRAKVRVAIRNRDEFNPYEFATETAGYYVCSQCGVLPVVVSEIEGRAYAVVNANTISGLTIRAEDVEAVNYERETRSERLARRARQWIGHCTVASARVLA